jgi:hypothetical protein
MVFPPAALMRMRYASSLLARNLKDTNSLQSNQFFKELPYDLLAIGNHELYIYNNTLDMHQNFAPRFNGRYLSSNVNITINGVSQPVGNRFAKFKTRKYVLISATLSDADLDSRGREVTALGVLYDFTGNDENTTVQPVEDMVKEAWVRLVPPFFFLSHLPVQVCRCHQRRA